MDEPTRLRASDFRLHVMDLAPRAEHRALQRADMRELLAHTLRDYAALRRLAYPQLRGQRLTASWLLARLQLADCAAPATGIGLAAFSWRLGSRAGCDLAWIESGLAGPSVCLRVLG